ncbi:MAG: hypothetical protein EXQ47_09505 [Bryobacterales bacterium]|nr:hypothetical protein [Bryobacterales bacterium]
MLAWFALIAVETVHGVLRNLFLVPVVGDAHARQIGVVVGSALVLATAFAFIRWMRPASMRAALWIGALGRSWDQLLADYDLNGGGYLSFGMVLLGLAPWIAAKLRPGSDSPGSGG